MSLSSYISTKRMNKKTRQISGFACAAALAMCAAACNGTQNVSDAGIPEWLESDSAEAIHQRLLRDFPKTFEDGAQEIIEKYEGTTIDSVRAYVDRKYIETMEIDGQERMFRKSVRNLGLLNPAFNGGWKHRGYNASPDRISYADSIIRHSRGQLPDGGAHKVKIRFSIYVPYHEILRGDTLRAWLPFPIESERQGEVKLLSTYPSEYIVSTPQQSVHRTVYLQQPVEEGDTAHFEYIAEFTTAGSYFSPETIKRNLKAYDKNSEMFRKYTAFDGPHYVRLDSLASAIVGGETNPYAQSELVYDYIITHFPWAGAREYSTIPSLPLYVVNEGHGDCGQVALLYISLMRTLGVPARWESGWMLHPGEKNYHDWAEVYYEGVGWVPVDVSFGRYTTSEDPEVIKFYSTGIDSYRMATNTGVGGAFFPAKRFIRSETVDSQAGEVESTKGNMFYPAWDQTLEIISVEPVIGKKESSEPK